MGLPIRKDKRKNQRLVQAWVERAYVERLKESRVNVSELIRQAILEAIIELDKNAATKLD